MNAHGPRDGHQADSGDASALNPFDLAPEAAATPPRTTRPCSACEAPLHAQGLVCSLCGQDQRQPVKPTNKQLQRRGVRKLARCPKCDYDLTGLKHPICPECGKSLPTHGQSRRAQAQGQEEAYTRTSMITSAALCGGALVVYGALRSLVATGLQWPFELITSASLYVSGVLLLALLNAVWLKADEWPRLTWSRHAAAWALCLAAGYALASVFWTFPPLRQSFWIFIPLLFTWACWSLILMVM